MRHTPSTRIAYQLMAQAVLLLVVYAGGALLAAVKFLGEDPLAYSFPYHQADALAHATLHLAILSGLVASGIYITASDREDTRLNHETLLSYTALGWTGLLALAVLAGALGLLENRAPLGLPLLLALLQIMLTALFAAQLVLSVKRWTAVPLVWAVGIVTSLACSALGLLTSNDFIRDARLAALVSGLYLYVGCTLAAAAAGFWLMHRFSNVTPGWADSGLYTVAGLLAIAGTLASVSPLYALDTGRFARALGSVGSAFVPFAYAIFAAHSYRAFSDRNQTSTLSAHWLALALLLFLAGAGALGMIQAVPGINQWIQGTRLTDLRLTITALAVMAVVLGVTNQAAAELRGENRRVTGLLPFWLMAFGFAGAGAALAGAGITQVYLERVLSVGYLDTQRYLIPLYLGWTGGLLAAALGILIYALGFWARRPR